MADELRAFAQYTVNGLTVGAFYALVALGYTIVYGIIRLINFAHGDLAMVAGFLAWTLTASPIFAHLPPAVGFLMVFLVPMAATALLNAAILRIAYQPLLSKSILAILIVALGVGQVLENGARLIYGGGFDVLPGNLMTQGGIALGGVQTSYVQLILLLLSIALMAGLYWFTTRTTIGMAMRALAFDHDAARSMGINVERIILVAFIVGGALAAAAGVMIAFYYGVVTFTAGFLLGLRAFTAAVLGGIGNIPGAMLGGLLIGLLQSYCAGYVSSRWQDVLVFGVLIAILIVKPTGLLGERVAERM